MSWSSLGVLWNHFCTFLHKYDNVELVTIQCKHRKESKLSIYPSKAFLTISVGVYNQQSYPSMADQMTPGSSDIHRESLCIGTSNGWCLITMLRKILIPVFGGLTSSLGFIGNMLVIIVVICNQKMKNTTNILILNLAVADLLFILMYVLSRTTYYAMSDHWPFGETWCKISEYAFLVTTYVAVYTLTLMSLDRYLAVMHPVTSARFRIKRNTWMITFFLWLAILVGQIPFAIPFTVEHYVSNTTEEGISTCFNPMLDWNTRKRQIFNACFFSFGYAAPLVMCFALFVVMSKHILQAIIPRLFQSGETSPSKMRATRMVAVVVIIFAICWLPYHVLLFIIEYAEPPEYPMSASWIAVTCLIYLKPCINPVTYAIVSDNFRKSLKKILSVQRRNQPQVDDSDVPTDGSGGI